MGRFKNRIKTALATARCPVDYTRDCAMAIEPELEDWAWDHIVIGTYDEAKHERHDVIASLILDGMAANVR